MNKDNCISRIKKEYFNLRPSEVKVAEFVIRNIKDASKMSIGKLSEITGVSQPSIIRFVKALDYSGYREFKDNMIAYIASDSEAYNRSLLHGFNLKKRK